MNKSLLPLLNQAYRNLNRVSNQYGIDSIEYRKAIDDHNSIWMKYHGIQMDSEINNENRDS